MTEERLEELIAEWHDMPTFQYIMMGCPELYEYLGWNCGEYAHWVETGEMPNEG